MHKFTIKHTERASRAEKAADVLLAIAIGLFTAFGLISALV